MNKALVESYSDKWETPQELFDVLDSEFGFTLDPCATAETAKCPKYFNESENGLAQNWTGEVVYCNPPYGRKQDAWVRKCSEHGANGGTAVMLLPARTDTARFHDLIFGKSEIRFLRGRLKFKGAAHPAPFPSMIVIFREKIGTPQQTAKIGTPQQTAIVGTPQQTVKIGTPNQVAKIGTPHQAVIVGTPQQQTQNQ